MIKYIFCINPGRTGSEYISKVFSCVDGVAAFHEPKPIMHGPQMQAFLMGDPSPMEKMMDEKIAFMNDSLRQSRYYVETNHCFIKGFGWLLPGRVPESEIGVIVLKREKSLVVDSLYKVNAHPFSTTGEKWIITPQFYRDNITPFPKGYSAFLFWFQKIKYRLFNRLRKKFNSAIPEDTITFAKSLIGWYVEETYALGEAYKKKFPGVRMVELDLSDLNTVEGFEKVLTVFNIPLVYTQDMNEVIGKKVNEREHAFKMR